MAYGNGMEKSEGSDNKPPLSIQPNGLVDRFLTYTKDRNSPEIFRRWVILHAVGSAVERRVWGQAHTDVIYPNMYVFLIGPPGVGKTQAIKPILNPLRKSQSCTLAPNDMSKQGLLDAFPASYKTSFYKGDPFDFHYMAAYITEITNLMSEYNKDLAGLLTALWDCEDMNEEVKRHGKGKTLVFPGLSLCLGAATESLGSIITPDLWGSGFMARVVLVYCEQEVQAIKDMFAMPPDNTAMELEIEMRLGRLGQLNGPMTWEREAEDLMNHFRLNQKDTEPPHRNLAHYNTRRWMQVYKLSMIWALSEESMTIEPLHFHNALASLLEAEQTMSDVFGSMNISDDARLLDDIAHTVWEFNRENKRAISSAELTRILSRTAPLQKIEWFKKIAEEGDYIRRVAGSDEYVPSPRAKVDR